MSSKKHTVLPVEGYRVLEGRLGLVTGAARGIGIAICHNLASKGCNLILNYNSSSSAEAATRLRAELEQKYNISCLEAQADVSSEDGASQMVEKAKEHFSKLLGKFQIDIVVNNAGVAKDAEIPDVDWKTFEWIYKINVWGPIKVMQAVLPYLPHDRSGRIVNVSSVSSTQGFIGQTMYGGTKAALEAMTRSWSREVAERATVNSINPGPVHTEMWSGTSALFRQRTNAWMRHTPLAAARPEIDTEGVMKGADELGGREAYPEEIAGIIGMLCTPDSSWCTGQSICANGGFIFN